MSKPIGPNVTSTCFAGFPANTLRWMALPRVFAPISSTPLILPPNPFSSMMLSWLLPINPMPKSRLRPASASARTADPLPPSSFLCARTRALPAIHMPPQGKVPEPMEFRAATFSANSLSVTAVTQMPL
jgi:hypothetical protein